MNRKDIESRANNQAFRDADDFIDNHEWPDILKRYAYISNKWQEVGERFARLAERGGGASETDWDNFYYFRHYRELLALLLATETLKDKGYKQDNHGFWIL